MRPLPDKSNHRVLQQSVLWLTTTGVCACLLLLIVLLMATCLFLPVKIVTNTDWGHEARMITFQPDNASAELRYLLVPFTPFGEDMVHEFLRVSPMADMSLSSSHVLSVVATNPASLERWRYLDYVLAARLWLERGLDAVKRTRATTLAARSEAAPASAIEPLFTDGLASHPDYTLTDKLQQLVRGADPGSTIRFSVFLFFYDNEHEPLLDDLVAAAARGVNVQLLIDLPEAEFTDRRTIGQLFKEKFEKRLDDAAKQGHSNSWIKTHPHKREHSKNHTKIFLFSHAMQMDHVVVITSENLTDREREKYQAGFLVRDATLYAQMSHYIDVMQSGDLPAQALQVTAADLSGFLFPQVDDDPVYRELERLRTTPEQMEQGHLAISMARWNHERFALAMKLVQLARECLDITVVMRSNDEIVDTQIRDVLKERANIHLHTVDVNQINIHSKYMLFDGYYKTGDDARRGKIVWTGSHNFTGAGLTDNYETWFEIHSDTLYDAYLDNFHQIEVLVPEAAQP